MPDLLIKRSISEHGNYGFLVGPGNRIIAITLELPWKDNQQNVSAIPFGTYKCRRVNSPRFGITFEILNVPGRGNVLFHWGNKLKNTEGCILLGQGVLFDSMYLLASRVTFDKFMKLQEGVDEFTLHIINT